MVAKGSHPKDNVLHIRDRFLWSPDITMWSQLDIVRMNYFTSATCDHDEIERLEQTIAGTTFTCIGGQHLGVARLLPHVHKKPNSSRKTKVVDVDLTVAAMRAALTMPVDGILIATGDGDYLPLLDEITRSSKQAYLAAFSSGLEPSLKTRVEQFIDLDQVFFSVSQREQGAGQPVQRGPVAGEA